MYLCKKYNFMKRFLGLILILCVVIFQTSMTTSYGNNLLPSSPQELGFDILSLILFIFGVILVKSKRPLF